MCKPMPKEVISLAPLVSQGHVSSPKKNNFRNRILHHRAHQIPRHELPAQKAWGEALGVVGHDVELHDPLVRDLTELAEGDPLRAQRPSDIGGALL